MPRLSARRWNRCPKGQLEAGQCVGMSYMQIMWRIILPQALRTAFPTLAAPDRHGQGYLSGGQYHRDRIVHDHPAHRRPHLTAGPLSGGRPCLPAVLHGADPRAGLGREAAELPRRTKELMMLEIHDLQKSFGDLHVLRGINLNIQGDVVASSLQQRQNNTSALHELLGMPMRAPWSLTASRWS